MSEVAIDRVQRPLPRGLGEWWRSPWFLRLTSIAVVLGAWETYGRMIPVIFISRPSMIAAAAADLLSSQGFWRNLWQTVTALGVGFAIAIVLGTVLGFLMGRSRTLNFLLDPYVAVLYATPRVALIPLLIMVFGIDFQLRLGIVVLSSMFPILINTMNGVRNVEQDLIETAVAFNANERQILRTVVVPATLPFVLSGIQIALGQAIIGVIVAEITVGISGIGGLLVEYGNAFKTHYMLVPILATSTISILLVSLLRLLEQKIMPYRFLGPRREPAWKRLLQALSLRQPPREPTQAD